MLSSMAFAFNAVMPIVALMAFGYWLRQRGVFDAKFLKTANSFNFRWCLSAMLFCNVYSLGDLRDIPWTFAIFSLAVFGVFTLIGWLCGALFTTQRRRKSVLMQNAFRSNMSIIGLPLAEAMAGSAGAVVASAMQAPAIIYFNLVAVVVLTVYADNGQTVDFKKIGRSIIKNPLIIGLSVGMLCLALRMVIPTGADGQLLFSLKGSLPWLYTAMNNLGKIASPFALVVLGGQFDFAAVKGAKKELLVGVLCRLLVCPMVGYAAAFAAQAAGLFTLDAGYIATMVGMFASPVAVSSAVMATEMGADDQLANQLVVWTCLGSMVTVFLQIVVFRSLGML